MFEHHDTLPIDEGLNTVPRVQAVLNGLAELCEGCGREKLRLSMNSDINTGAPRHDIRVSLTRELV